MVSNMMEKTCLRLKIDLRQLQNDTQLLENTNDCQELLLAQTQAFAKRLANDIYQLTKNKRIPPIMAEKQEALH